MVAVSDAINEPRYPSLKGIMGAKSKPQETLSLRDLGLDAGGWDPGRRPWCTRSARRRRAATLRMIEDDGSRREQILDFLVERS